MMARHSAGSRSLLSLFVALLLALSSLALSSAQEYTVGPRDILKITVWGQDDLTRDYPVDQDGFVPFPLVGRVRAAGLTVREFASRLTELLEKDYLVNPQVSVSVKEYLSKKVHVLGEAERPGLFYLTGETTILEILSKAGGPSRTAGKQLVLVRNQRPADGGTGTGNTILRLDLEKIQAGDAQQNIRVEDEDTVFIPKANAFFVLGEVRTPGAFPLDKEISALEAVTIAGGFNEKAAPAGVKLIRRAADGKQETISLDLSRPVSRDRMARIQDGDTVLVPKGNAFFVFGEVRKPGAYQLERATTILEGITMAGGFTDKAAPGRTRVIRNTPTGQQGITVDVNDIIKRGQRDKALQLQENDVVVVPESFF
jgi:polysaccharide biosynthesis/export protein